ncbi:hypothetical protein BRD03_05595 [Halobacteriales archaeon QS_9_68_17]|nr:MAG: hypothetical protein BRD03_05595 [Halobacteriales archaeon QS_9_68_17]
MKRFTVIALVILLAAPVQGLAVPTGPVDPASADGTPASTAPPQADESNTTARLSLSDAATGRAVLSHNLAQSLSTADERMRTNFRVRTFEAELSATDSAQARASVADETLTDIGERTAALKRTEREAVRSFANGSITETRLLRTLAQVDASAELLDDAVGEHRRLSATITGYSAADRRQAIAVELAMLRTPVRGELRESFGGSGDGSLRLTQVSASQRGIVIETVGDGNYYREAVRFDDQDDNATDTFDGDAASVLGYAEDFYGWASENKRGEVRLAGIYDGRWRVSIPHQQGSLTTYIDGSTRSVFREVQTLRIDRLPDSNTVRASGDEINVTINQTPHGGPVQVRATDDAGRPIPADVAINDEPVGRTGNDGTLWTLEPRSYYLVTVSTGSETVNTTVRP